MNKNNTHFFHLQNLKKNTNDYYDILINIYLIVDRKKNTTLVVFAMDAPFSRYPNMSLPARIHDSEVQQQKGLCIYHKNIWIKIGRFFLARSTLLSCQDILIL